MGEERLKQQEAKHSGKPGRFTSRLLLSLLGLALIAACSSPAPTVLNLSAGDIVFETDEVSKTLVLRNSGDSGSSLNWSASVAYEGEASGWLNLTPASGSTPGGGASTLTLAADRTGLAPGEYRARLNIRSDGGDAAINVILRVTQASNPSLGELPETLEFDAAQINQTLVIRNDGDLGSLLLWRASITYEGAATGWLNVSPPEGSIAGSAADALALLVDRQNLQAGTYQARLNITSNGGTGSVIVVLNVAEPSRPQLGTLPESIEFDAGSVTETLLVMNSGNLGSSLNWTTSVVYQGSAFGWLNITPASGTAAGGSGSTLTLSVDRENLQPGDYRAQITLNSNGGNAVVNVLMRVAELARPQLSGLPASVEFTATEPGRTISLSNEGTAGSTLKWQVAVVYEGAAAGWLEIEPPAGSIASGTTTTMTLSINRDNLQPGDYRARLTINSNGGNTAIDLLLRVAALPTPRLEPLESTINFPSGTDTVILGIRNVGEEGSSLNWRVSASYQGNASGWLSVSPASGATARDERNNVSLTVNRQGLAPGSYNATLTINSNGGNRQIAVVLVVAAPEPIPVLTAATTEVDFGGTANTRTLSISNTGAPGSALQWSISKSYGEGTPDWLTVTPGSGSTAAGATSSVTLSANRAGLAPGDYEAALNLSSNGGNATVTVRLRVPAPVLTELTFTLSPASLAFGGSTSQATFTLTNTHPRAITWTASADAAWLSLVNPSSAERGEPLAPGASDTVQVLVNRSGLTPGAYQATITVSAADSADPSLTRQQSVAVSMQVPAAEPPPATASISGRVTTANAAIPVTTAAQGEAADGFTTSAFDAPTGARAAYAPGELLVRYHTDGVGTLSGESLYTQSVRTLADDFNLTVLRTGDPGLPDVVALPPGADEEAAARRLEQDPRVLSATPNYYVYSQSVPNDPRVREQWALAASGLPAAWGRETGGSSRVVVAVIDSGFALNHPDLAGRFLPGYDFCAVPGCSATDNNPTFGETQNFHGSHVAGLIGAIGGNGVGVAGAAHGANLRLLPIKVYPDDGGAAPISALIDALNYAVGIPVTTRDGRRVSNPNPARVINMSLGGDFEMPFALQEAINNAHARGALVVVATGNDGAGRVQSPAAADGVLGVGAHNQAFRRSCFSNYGRGGAGTFGPGGVDILAPGGDKFLRCRSASQGLLSTVPGNGYSDAIGTSMAAPMVAGVAALILSREPGLSVSQLESRLTGSAYFDASYMSATEYGAGILRADRALGLPGPGDTVTVVATGPGTAQANVTLDLFGGSSSYTLRNLRAGAYTVSAGQQGGLFGQRQVSVSDGQSLGGQDVGVRAAP